MSFYKFRSLKWTVRVIQIQKKYTKKLSTGNFGMVLDHPYVNAYWETPLVGNFDPFNIPHFTKVTEKIFPNFFLHSESGTNTCYASVLKMVILEIKIVSLHFSIPQSYLSLGAKGLNIKCYNLSGIWKSLKMFCSKVIVTLQIFQHHPWE